MPDLSGTMRKCRMGTAKNFTLLLLLYLTQSKDGVRIAELTERSYRKLLWNHTPLTDFWRIGNGYAKKLMENGMFTMGMGPTTIAEIRAYKPQNNSVSSRQVLHCPIQQRKQSLL